MAIYFNEQEKTFHLEGKDYSYIMGVAYDRFLSHLYYGKKVNMLHPSRKMVSRELGFSPSPLEFFYNRSVSLDTLPQEFPSFGYTDFRIPAIIVEQENGSRISDFRYSSYQITNSKPKISNMPSIHDDGKVTTLIIDLVDEVINVVAHLIYNVYEERNVLTRHVIIENKGKEKIKLTKVMSMSFDMHDANFNFMQLHGTHCKERHIEISPLRHGITKIESRRGSSSHMMNPFFALMRKNCDENQGEIFGFNFVYSGNYEGCVEVDQRETARIQMGISGFDFEWELKSNEKFETPEVVMVYSDQGINDMSNTFHDLYNQCLLKKQYHHPIVVNNWEATYFDFNEEKLTKLIQSAKGLGIETFVLDDGWFGKRNNDESSLGDWKVNLTKLPGGLEKISQIANENGLKFGLWFEPEAISIDSDLYRAHPDYAIKIANRDHAVSRCELLLDLSRKESIDINQKIKKDISGTQTVSHGSSSSTVVNEKYSAEYETIFDNGLVNITTTGYKTEGDLRKGLAKTAGEKTVYKFSQFAQQGHDHFADKMDGNQIIENDGTIARDMDPAFAGHDGYKGDLLYGLDDFAGIQNIKGQSARDYVRDEILKKGRIKKTNKLSSDIDWTMDSFYVADDQGNIIGRVDGSGNISGNSGSSIGTVTGGIAYDFSGHPIGRVL